ncbi:hypothetical protein SAMN06265379_102271 [Saccharicrinis carchari]|uniref:Uncharacterized protein n=1 Tax=Saccharicrinis carchari TaxID=1168039 RepID=A0A521C268_SACCC|nr:hypothetical protein [Saccharicrinis carchari]SMO52820.1 hypothetical protein SAMN06265379_102271 [Saccharicrinis carchari]
MAKWAADFALAAEVNQDVINLVLDKFIQALKSILTFTKKMGQIGSIQAEVIDLSIRDLSDPPPLGAVITDTEAEGIFKLKLFGLTIINTNIVFRIEKVELNLAKTAAGLPKGIIINITPGMKISLTFPQSRFIIKWLLNSIIGPLISFGVWLAFRIIRKVEIPVWELVDIFGALGLRFTPDSPLLTAQKASPPTSLLLASDFNLTNPLRGTGTDLKHFIPANTNVGAVVHERVLSAAVQLAFAKGWVPTRFRVGKYKIYINSIYVEFKQDKIVASGSLKAKRGKCWCKVKVKITFSAAVEPKIINTQTPNPLVDFKYDANVNTQVAMSGMLVVLGVIMFAPVFLSLTVSMSFLINIVLNQFLPFSTTWSQSGANLTIQAKSVHFSGFVPFRMNFPLQLSGKGSYDLSRFRQFQLPNNGPVIQVGYTPESLAIQEDEIRVAVALS